MEPQSLASIFTDCSARHLAQLRGRIVTCLGKLNHEQVWMRGGDHENAIGNLVLHLCGNVRQWVGTGVAGKPDIRVRDREFLARGDVDPADLAERITAIVDDAIEIIRALDEEQMRRVVKIQVFELTVMEAVMHVLEHFGQHTGQIILLTKHATGEDLGFYSHLSGKHTAAGGTP